MQTTYETTTRPPLGCFPRAARGAPTPLKRRLLGSARWWAEEYFYAAVCVVTTVSLGVLLAVFDGRPVVQRLPLGVELGAVFIALMTAVRISLKAIVEACISQGAWLWVSGARRRKGRGRRAAKLDHFRLFDEASRGLLGSLVLL